MDLTWRNFWFESKAWFESHIGLSKDVMHVHFGLGVFLSCALLMRKRRNGPLWAWCIVVLLQTMNEAMDARDWINWTGSLNWTETARDYAATLFWPTVLLLIWRGFGRAE
jgi:hypothetical protein